MAFGVNEVVRVACMSAWLVCYQLRDRLAGYCTDQQQATMKMTMKAISHFEINCTSLP